jgi:cation:H+ antiporter
MFLGGIVLLIKGADYFVESSSRIAAELGVSSLFIGLTLVAFGTSAPEAAVSIQAAARGAGDISFGNIIGSNIANIGLVLGVSALILPVKISKSTLNKELPFIILATAALFLMSFDSVIDGVNVNELSRSEGLILLIFFLIFIEYTVTMAKADRINFKSAENKPSGEKNKIARDFVIAGISLAAIVYGGDMVVHSGISLADSLGVSDTFIAVTMIALGTSLPELVTSIMAVIKKKDDIALGNIIGSCIFNILFVLGTSIAVKPFAVRESFMGDMGFNFIVLILLFVFAINFGRKSRVNKISRAEGGIFLLIYLGYMVFNFIRL